MILVNAFLLEGAFFMSRTNNVYKTTKLNIWCREDALAH